MTAVLDTALSYASAGLPVFPVGADKKPILKNSFHGATRDANTIDAWFRNNPRAGVAIPMGPPTKLWALDIDVERINPETGEVTPSGEETLAALVDRYGPLPSTLAGRAHPQPGGRPRLRPRHARRQAGRHSRRLHRVAALAPRLGRELQVGDGGRLRPCRPGSGLVDLPRHLQQARTRGARRHRDHGTGRLRRPSCGRVAGAGGATPRRGGG